MCSTSTCRKTGDTRTKATSSFKGRGSTRRRQTSLAESKASEIVRRFPAIYVMGIPVSQVSFELLPEDQGVLWLWGELDLSDADASLERGLANPDGQGEGYSSRRRWSCSLTRARRSFPHRRIGQAV